MIDVLWLGNSIKQETRKKLKIGYQSGDMKLSEVIKDYTKEIVSHNPSPIGPYYAYNDHYLEIRGGMFENFRGIITWISIFLPTYLSGYLWVGIALLLLNHETTKIISNTFVMVIALILFLITFYFIFAISKYVLIESHDKSIYSVLNIVVAQQYSNGNTLCPLILVKQARIWGGN